MQESPVQVPRVKNVRPASIFVKEFLQRLITNVPCIAKEEQG